ncbi:translation initiation inhibitor [Cenarchaeum symbiosum A]|uniref:Translation initiation inhibitor n=1 Tax=Cenarchaeum symbiosum (strain A) TaxID=414004 RepID=A0RVT4_CENSY|nr:translation initiation inhibitor [Cenarchaeum symbiosum A]
MIADRLQKLGIILPEPPAPAGSYVPVAVSGSLAFVSGQVPSVDGAVKHTGEVGDENIEEGRSSARICIINAIAQLNRELGTLERISRIVKVTGYVRSAPGFTRQPEVVNAASDLLFEVFGEAGRHARAAVGVPALPLGAMTEIEVVAELGPAQTRRA